MSVLAVPIGHGDPPYAFLEAPKPTEFLRDERIDDIFKGSRDLTEAGRGIERPILKALLDEAHLHREGDVERQLTCERSVQAEVRISPLSDEIGQDRLLYIFMHFVKVPRRVSLERTLLFRCPVKDQRGVRNGFPKSVLSCFAFAHQLFATLGSLNATIDFARKRGDKT